MKGVTSFLNGALLGAVVGAAIAILIAPSSGEELRAQIQERIQTIRDEMNSAAGQRRDELEQQLAQLRAPRKSSGGE